MAVRIIFVCYGNICRSPTAEFVMKHLAKGAGVDAEISSAGTHAEWKDDVNAGMQHQMDINGIPWDHRESRQLAQQDYGRYDIIVGMDDDNMRDMRGLFGGDPDGKLRLLLGDRELDDPYYTRDFARAYREILQGCNALLDEIRRGVLGRLTFQPIR